MRIAGLLIAVGGLAGASAVTLGAVGSHLLRARLPDAEYEIFTVALEYLLVHAAVLCGCGVAVGRPTGRGPFIAAGVLLMAGIVLFCGGLMGRVVFGLPALGRFAPLGGSALILAWLAIAAGGVMHYRHGR